MREVTEKGMGSVSLLLVALAIFLSALAAHAQQAVADDWQAVALNATLAWRFTICLTTTASSIL